MVRRRSAQRGTRQEQGYGAEWYRVQRAAIAAQPWCSQCSWPGDSRNPLTGDHIIPKSKGGLATLENCRVLCRSCNSKRGNRTD